MINFKKLGDDELKKFANAEKIAAFEDGELVGFFAETCNHMYKYEGSVKAENVAEGLYWKAVLDMVDKELVKRDISVSYIGITKGYEAESIIDLLENPEFDLDLSTVITALDMPTLLKVEQKISEKAAKNPKRYGNVLALVRKQLSGQQAYLN